MPRFLAGLIVAALLAVASPARAGGGTGARKPEARPLQLFHASPSPKGTILMFHGFSSGPSQWHGEARHRFNQGYDVIVAALPGHGYLDKDGREDLSRLPGAGQEGRYEKFAHAVFEQARSRSDKVHVVGFSVGGAQALEVAMANHGLKDHNGESVIRSVVAINPFLSPTPKKIAGLSVNPHALARLGDKLSFGLVGKLLPRHEYVFQNAVRKQKVGEPDVGFTRVDLGHIYAIGRFGDGVQARARALEEQGGLRRPAFLVISEKDPTADPGKGQRLADQIGATKILLSTDKHNPFLWRTSTEPAELKLRAEVHRTISRALEAGRSME